MFLCWLRLDIKYVLAGKSSRAKHKFRSTFLQNKNRRHQVRETGEAAERINMKHIIIKTYKVPESKSKLVKLQRDANDIITAIQREQGLSKAYIVSEIIRQAAPYVEFLVEKVPFYEEEDTEC